ncbi:MAG: saccharopine dehydrogenase NADP-binding domain-containing protein [Labilithrix sp.]|nr:saccharopine dehydrogenase NADP-binding domain-containing protein [Labilithrix sp.]MCW5817349.1 saccharopine dehydrogenase NADP-binding domain-containing protein [Labilithrix sp.]
MNVVVYGANGWTGSLVAKTLERRGGFRLVLAGRNEEKLQALRATLPSRPEVRVADPRDRAALERMLLGADVIVHCAGPYRDLGEAMLDASLALGCHYFDVSGEYEFVRSIYERYMGEAHRRGLTFCPGFAVKGVFGDWLASIAAGPSREPIDEVAVAYAHALREYLFASPGSILAAASQGLFNQHDRYDPARSIARRFEFPPPFGVGTALLVPMTDEVTIPRHLPTPIVRNYVAVAPGTPANDVWATFFTSQLRAMPLLATAIRANPTLFKTLGESRAIVPTGVTFAALAEVTRNRRVHRAAVTLADGYQATADIVAYALRQLPSAPRGAITPSELCDPRRALRELARARLLSLLRWSEAR